MLYNKMREMLKKKKGLSDVEKDAKMDVVSHLRDEASSAMKGKMGKLKKASSESESEDGVNEGIKKAQQMLDDKSSASDNAEAEGQHDDESSDHSSVNPYSGDEERDEEDFVSSPQNAPSPNGDEMMSEDDIDAQLEQLMARKKKMASKK